MSSVEVAGTTTVSAEDTAAASVEVHVHDVPRTGISQAIELDAGVVRFPHNVHLYLRLTWKCEVGAQLGLKRLIWG